MTFAPQILNVHFVYHEQTVFLRIVRRAPVVFAFTCPVCRIELEIDRRTHRLKLDWMTREATITPDVRCPQCGFYALVLDGVATDLDVPPSAEPPGGVVVTSHTERARVCACGRRFSSKSKVRCRACREYPAEQRERRASARLRAK